MRIFSLYFLPGPTTSCLRVLVLANCCKRQWRLSRRDRRYLDDISTIRNKSKVNLNSIILPGPHPSLLLSKIPAESVSNTRRRASPGESGVPTLNVARSTINSIAYAYASSKFHLENRFQMSIIKMNSSFTQSSRFDQTGERIQKSLMTLITRTQFWSVLALAWNHLARRSNASECKQSFVFRRPSLIAAASFISTSLPGNVHNSNHH